MRRGTTWRLATRAEITELRSARPTTRGVPLLTSAALPFAVSAQLVACNCKCGPEDSWLDSAASGCDPPVALPFEDFDGDGLTNNTELMSTETDRLLPDTDFDGITDGDERKLGTNPLEADSDGGGTIDGLEIVVYTDPLVGTDDIPVKHRDADADDLDDALELLLGTDPSKPDTDLDGLSDGAETGTHRTWPIRSDTDGDGQSDGKEIESGTDPRNPCG